MFRDFADRHGCRDLGLVRVFACQGSATGDPCISRFSTFLPAFLEHISHGLCNNGKPDRSNVFTTYPPLYSGLLGVSASEDLQKSTTYHP